MMRAMRASALGVRLSSPPRVSCSYPFSPWPEPLPPPFAAMHWSVAPATRLIWSGMGAHNGAGQSLAVLTHLTCWTCAKAGLISEPGPSETCELGFEIQRLTFTADLRSFHSIKGAKVHDFGDLTCKTQLRILEGGGGSIFRTLSVKHWGR
jgi:hypothetical protein